MKLDQSYIFVRENLAKQQEAVEEAGSSTDF